jgi:hypothetical protein
MPQIQEEERSKEVDNKEDEEVVFRFNHSDDLLLDMQMKNDSSMVSRQSSNHSRQASGVTSRGHRRMLSRRNSMLSSGN